MKKILSLIFVGLLLVNIYGCFLLVAGAAGGAGTAMWLSGKLTEEIKAPYENTINATKSALKSLKLPIAKETRELDVTQLRSRYTDGKEIWIDIKRITDTSTKVEMRVGAVSSDKEAASKILEKIHAYL